MRQFICGVAIFVMLVGLDQRISAAQKPTSQPATIDDEAISTWFQSTIAKIPQSQRDYITQGNGLIEKIAYADGIRNAVVLKNAKQAFEDFVLSPIDAVDWIGRVDEIIRPDDLLGPEVKLTVCDRLHLVVALRSYPGLAEKLKAGDILVFSGKVSVQKVDNVGTSPISPTSMRLRETSLKPTKFDLMKP